jgi:hypothetical protein
MESAFRQVEPYIPHDLTPIVDYAGLLNLPAWSRMLQTNFPEYLQNIQKHGLRTPIRWSLIRR